MNNRMFLCLVKATIISGILLMSAGICHAGEKLSWPGNELDGKIQALADFVKSHATQKDSVGAASKTVMETPIYRQTMANSPTMNSELRRPLELAADKFLRKINEKDINDLQAKYYSSTLLFNFYTMSKVKIYERANDACQQQKTAMITEIIESIAKNKGWKDTQKKVFQKELEDTFSELEKKSYVPFFKTVISAKEKDSLVNDLARVFTENSQGKDPASLFMEENQRAIIKRLKTTWPMEDLGKMDCIDMKEQCGFTKEEYNILTNKVMEERKKTGDHSNRNDQNGNKKKEFMAYLQDKCSPQAIDWLFSVKQEDLTGLNAIANNSLLAMYNSSLLIKRNCEHLLTPFVILAELDLLDKDGGEISNNIHRFFPEFQKNRSQYHSFAIQMYPQNPRGQGIIPFIFIKSNFESVNKNEWQIYSYLPEFRFFAFHIYPVDMHANRHDDIWEIHQKRKDYKHEIKMTNDAIPPFDDVGGSFKMKNLGYFQKKLEDAARSSLAEQQSFPLNVDKSPVLGYRGLNGDRVIIVFENKRLHFYRYTESETVDIVDGAVVNGKKRNEIKTDVHLLAEIIIDVQIEDGKYRLAISGKTYPDNFQSQYKWFSLDNKVAWQEIMDVEHDQEFYKKVDKYWSNAVGSENDAEIKTFLARYQQLSFSPNNLEELIGLQRRMHLAVMADNAPLLSQEIEKLISIGNENKIFPVVESVLRDAYARAQKVDRKESLKLLCKQWKTVVEKLALSESDYQVLNNALVNCELPGLTETLADLRKSVSKDKKEKEIAATLLLSK